MEEEHDALLKKIKSRNAAGLDKIPPEVCKTSKFDDILLQLCIAVYKGNTIEKWKKRLHPPLPMKGDFRINKNYLLQ